MKTRAGALLPVILGLLLLAAMPAPAAEPAKPHWWDRLDTMAKRDGYHLIRPADLKSLYDRSEPMVVIDARTVYEFRAGHLPGARSVEFHLGHARGLEPAKEKQLLETLGPNHKRRVVVYDRGLNCVRSQLAAQWAVSMGYENVWHLAEGWMGWAALTQTQGARAGGVQPASDGDPFPGKMFTLLDAERDRAYLGLAPDAVKFELGALTAKYALVELYNELCFACCQSVPELNRLLNLINNDPALAKRLKMIGVGVGNRNRDVHRFRREKKVGFPLFSDQGGRLHKHLGEPDLPVIYLVRLRSSSECTIVSVLSGPFDSADALLGQLRRLIESDK